MITLRKATETDSKLYFQWANDPETRANSINTSEIKWKDHLIWFNNKLNAPDSYLYLMEFNNQSIGQIRFEIENDDAIISFSIDPAYRGQHWGRKILALGIQVLLQTVKRKLNIIGKVKNNNIASIKAFEYNNFMLRQKENDYCYFHFTKN